VDTGDSWYNLVMTTQLSDTSQEHIDWLLAQLIRIQKSLPFNSQLEKDIGNIMSRFHTEILDEYGATSVLSLSTEKKFFRMVDDLSAILQREKLEYSEFKSHIPRQDHHVMLIMLEEILKKSQAWILK